MNIENNNTTEQHYKKSDNVVLEENGRIFPSWIMQNFKKFLLPEIIRKEGEDPCNEKLVDELFACDQPMTDPKGKPTLRYISLDEIRLKFGWRFLKKVSGVRFEV